MPLCFKEYAEKLLPSTNAHLSQHSPQDEQPQCHSSEQNHRPTLRSLLDQSPSCNCLKDKYLKQRLINSLSQNSVIHLTHLLFFLICVYRVFDLLVTDEFCYILKQVFLSEQIVVQMSVTLPGALGYVSMSSLFKAK